MRLIIVPITIALALSACVILAIFLFPDLGEIAEEWSKTSLKFKEGFFQAKVSFWGGFSDYFEPETDTSEPAVNSGPSSSTNGSYQPSTPSGNSGAPYTPYTPPTPPPSQEEPAVSINTCITSGPKEREIIDDTNEVTFEFESRISPADTEGYVYFETKVEGLDENWKRVYSNYETIRFEGGAKEYTFMVRAVIDNIVDPTPAKRTFKVNISPYWQKVKFYQVTADNWHSTYSPSTLITLYAQLYDEEQINITDWTIEGKKGVITIPRGIEKYDPSYGLLSSNSLPLKDIIVKNYDKVYISSDPNPRGRNRNFRLNKCFGYLDWNFTIYFYTNCPATDYLDILHLNPECQDYILGLTRCEVPNFENNADVARDQKCVDYINDHFNYTGCYKHHSEDNDFLESEWHIYANQNIVSGGYDTLYLRDKNGLLVDKIIYRGSW